MRVPKYKQKFAEIDGVGILESAKEELNEYILGSGFPVYLALKEDKVVGYIVLRIDGVVWVEQVYVKEERLKGYVLSFLLKCVQIKYQYSIYKSLTRPIEL